VGLDRAAAMLARAPRPAVRADATALPFPNASFPSVACLYVLYHLAEPARALAEAHRVLRHGGLVAVAVPSRHDSPELAHLLQQRSLTFDAELAPGLLGERFIDVEVQPWDAPLLQLPSRQAVRDYLVGKGVERARARSRRPVRSTCPCRSPSGARWCSRGSGGADRGWKYPMADP
jgi:SAM-dependent methyltransferase